MEMEDQDHAPISMQPPPPPPPPTPPISPPLPRTLHIIIIIMEIDIPRSPPIIRHKVTITGRSLIARISGQHALNAHADALDRLYG